MERSVLAKLALVWGMMVVTILVMVITQPASATNVIPVQQGGMSPGQMFGQATQFFHDMQSNITPPKGIG